MSQSEIIRFPRTVVPATDQDQQAADQARQRIASLPSAYANHAMPSKEALVGQFDPVSPAAAAPQVASSAPFKIGGGAQSAHHTGLKIKRHEEPTADKQAELPPAKPELQTVAAATPEVATPASTPVAAKSATKGFSNPLAKNTAVVPAKEVSTAPGPKTSEPKSLPSRFKPLIVGVVTFVLLFLVFKSPIFLNQLSYLIHGDKNPAAATTPVADPSAVAPEPTISIPKINVNAPVVYAANNAETAIQKDLESGVVHYANTALPGTNGNSVIFGHSSNDWWEPGNFKFVFVLLDKLTIGDTFTVNYNSHQYIYQVTETKVVEPTDLTVLTQTTDPQMTLITCTPPGTSWKRLVVKAKQISPAADTAAVTAPQTPQGTLELPGNSPGLGSTISKWWHNFVGVFKDDDKDSGSNSTTTPGNATTLPAAK